MPELLANDAAQDIRDLLPDKDPATLNILASMAAAQLQRQDRLGYHGDHHAGTAQCGTPAFFPAPPGLRASHGSPTRQNGQQACLRSRKPSTITAMQKLRQVTMERVLPYVGYENGQATARILTRLGQLDKAKQFAARQAGSFNQYVAKGIMEAQMKTGDLPAAWQTARWGKLNVLGDMLTPLLAAHAYIDPAAASQLPRSVLHRGANGAPILPWPMQLPTRFKRNRNQRHLHQRCRLRLHNRIWSGSAGRDCGRSSLL